MRFRNTLLLALLFLGLGAYLYVYEAPKLDDKAKHLFPDADPEQVSEVTLQHADPGSVIVLKKTGDGWRLTKPVDARADQEAVKNLVHAVTDAELKRTLDEKPKSLAEFGLDKPAVRVTLAMADGKKLPTVEVGKTSPVGWSTFIRLEGDDQVKLVPSAFHFGMDRQVKDLRDKAVLEFKQDDVRAVSIAGTDAPFKLIRSDETWKIAEPKPMPADDSEVRSFLSSLETLRATDFHDAPKALDEFGLDKPRRTIRIEVGKDGAAKELLVGGERQAEKQKDLYVKVSGNDTVYAVAASSWSSLDRALKDFRDKTLLAFDRDALGAIEVARKDGPGYRLTKTSSPAASTPAATPGAAEKPAAETKWTIEGEKASNDLEIGQLVSDLHTLKGYEIAAAEPADVSPYGLDNPDLRFSFYDAAGKPIGTVIVAQKAAEGDGDAAAGPPAYAMVEGGDLVLRLRDYVYSHLDKKRADLAAAEPAAASAANPSPESGSTAPSAPPAEVAPAPGS